MPDFDYVLLAEYVRQDAGMIHIMGAGIDTINVPPGALPAAVPVGIAVRVLFTSQDVPGAEHSLHLEFTGPGSEQLLSAIHRFRAPVPQAGMPSTWLTSVGIAIRIALPIPRLGNYALEARLDDDPMRLKHLDLRAIAKPPAR